MDDIIEGLNCYCDARDANCVGGKPIFYDSEGNRVKGTNSTYKKWRYKEMFALMLAITMFEHEIGRDAVTTFLSRVAFARVSDGPTSRGLRGLLGQYWPSEDHFAGFGGLPVILLTDMGAGVTLYPFPGSNSKTFESSSQMTWTLTHEIAHRADKYAEQTNLYSLSGNWHGAPNAGPTHYARTGGIDDDIAESITLYLWEKHSGSFIMQRKNWLGQPKDIRLLDSVVRQGWTGSLSTYDPKRYGDVELFMRAYSKNPQCRAGGWYPDWPSHVPERWWTQ